jgi:hypothetical protein
MPTITLAIWPLRSEQVWVVYTTDDPYLIVLQGRSAIARIDIRTGKGIMNTNGTYIDALDEGRGARQIIVPLYQVEAARKVAVTE